MEKRERRERWRKKTERKVRYIGREKREER